MTGHCATKCVVYILLMGSRKFSVLGNGSFL